jgi:hypothetical protein
VYPTLRNLSSPWTVAALLRSVTVLGALVLALCVAPVAVPQDLVAQAPVVTAVLDADDPGRFEVREASAELVDGVYFLNASIALQLSTEARSALESGVPLMIRFDVELIHGRRFWFDNEAASLRQLFQLEYHALSERYIVQNRNSGDQESFGTLASALAFVGRVEHLPLIDAALLDSDRDYDVRLRAVLDVEQFPGPLRLLAFWRRDWSLASEWYRWPLQSD